MSLEITKTVDIFVDLDDFDSEEIRTYVADNWGVEDVFSSGDIIDCCRSSFELDEIYNDSHVQDYCLDKQPENIFPESVLADWANRKGWKGPN
jgi:hypothetical protein